jgi:hypothetical protein
MASWKSASVAFLLVSGLGAALWTWSREEAPDLENSQEELDQDETGMTPQEREELMRTIGYVQQ